MSTNGPTNQSFATKTKVPGIDHTLSTPGYVIIVRFLWSCVFNLVVFTMTYAFLAVAIPLALLVRFVQKLVVFVRIYSDQATRSAEVANAGERFWFDASLGTRTPSLILLLVVRGHLGIQTVEYLVRNRLSPSSKDPVSEREYVWRLGRSPKRVFKTLLWIECNLADKTVNEVTLDKDGIFCLERRKFTIQRTFTNVDWEISVYSDAEQVGDARDVILFQFHHCFADIFTFVQFLSRQFLDEPSFAFREDVSSAQALCLGFVTAISGPGVLVRNIFKCKDTLFSLKPQTGNQIAGKRAIFYSEPVERSVIDTVTTATGASVFDVLLSCLAGSLRTSLRENGLPFPGDVNACLQTNLQSSASLKCFMSFNIFSLPVGTEGAIPRLWEMRLRHNNVSSYVQAITMNTMMQLAFFLLPESLARRLVQFFVAKSSCNVTCILGQTSNDELVLDGRSVETFVPVEDNGCAVSISIIEYERKFQLAVMAPALEDWVVNPARVCEVFTRSIQELSTRLAERARVVRARGQKLLNSRKNSVFTVEEEEE